jgi:PPOX class probable FMN-dependent enzyme
MSRIEEKSTLRAKMGEVSELAAKKTLARLDKYARSYIEHSPFLCIGTADENGHADVSPRGDPPGFVAVQDEKTLLMPERRGNNRIDSLRNIVADPRVALLFLIPGVGETLRVNGRAGITVAPELMARFAVDGKAPQCVVVIHVESVFFQCARAIQRSRLWAPLPAGAPRTVPTPGAILAALTGGEFDGESYDRELPARQRRTLY